MAAARQPGRLYHVPAVALSGRSRQSGMPDVSPDDQPQRAQRAQRKSARPAVSLCSPRSLWPSRRLHWHGCACSRDSRCKLGRPATESTKSTKKERAPDGLSVFSAFSVAGQASALGRAAPAPGVVQVCAPAAHGLEHERRETAAIDTKIARKGSARAARAAQGGRRGGRSTRFRAFSRRFRVYRVPDARSVPRENLHRTRLLRVCSHFGKRDH